MPNNPIEDFLASVGLRSGSPAPASNNQASNAMIGQAAQTPSAPVAPPSNPWAVNGGPPPVEGPGLARAKYFAYQANPKDPNAQFNPNDPQLLDDSIHAAKRQYPFLRKLPISLTSGSGKYQTETYLPKDKDNPKPGNLTIQLQSQQSRKPHLYPETIASEAIHSLYDSDPIYQRATKSFVDSMTDEQFRSAEKAYKQQAAQDPKIDSFEKWLPRVQAQEYIRGYLFQNVNPGWAGPQGEGGYTPEQERNLTNLKNYLMTEPGQPDPYRDPAPPQKWWSGTKILGK